MIPVTDLRPGIIYKEQDRLYRVLDYKHQKLGRGGATIIVKVQDLNRETILRKSFHSGSKVEGVQLASVRATYLYQQGDHFVFMDNKTYEQFEVSRQQLGGHVWFLKEGLEITVRLHEEKVIDIGLPLKVDYTVVEASPDVRGDTSQAGVKEVTLENGLKIKTPMFIKKDDKIIIDTRTGKYIERV